MSLYQQMLRQKINMEVDRISGGPERRAKKREEARRKAKEEQIKKIYAEGVTSRPAQHSE